MSDGSPTLKHIKYEVFGTVQGVFFRAHTEEKAHKLNLVGYVLNSATGTVQGVAQGPAPAIEEFKKFLQYEGSPASKIERAEFHEEKEVSQLEYDRFSVRG
eukprot:gb/GECG01016171.1/.p1 GENE.gb/GECG01016171.1/~~gb/GECG01016171.1/.p1  ORF type:complete len:101 (+),score=20.19 gb/GECG01016171.1/:1-303(+)